MRFAIGYFRTSLVYSQWDNKKKKQNKTKFLTIPLGITALMLSLFCNFQVVSTETDHSKKEKRKMFSWVFFLNKRKTSA